MLESLTEPGRGGYRLGVIRQDDGFAATVFEALASRLFADFFFNDRADLELSSRITVRAD
jgi:hypothetical protein